MRGYSRSSGRKDCYSVERLGNLHLQSYKANCLGSMNCPDQKGSYVNQHAVDSDCSPRVSALVIYHQGHDSECSAFLRGQDPGDGPGGCADGQAWAQDRSIGPTWSGSTKQDKVLQIVSYARSPKYSVRVHTGMNVSQSEAVSLGYIGEVIGRKGPPPQGDSQGCRGGIATGL